MEGTCSCGNNFEFLFAVLEGHSALLQELSLLLQYQVGLLSFLAGVFSAFLFLYGLRLR
jgi:hypothetical protein